MSAKADYLIEARIDYPSLSGGCISDLCCARAPI